MLNFEMTDVEELPYLYVERSCSMDPSDISAAMGGAFDDVISFMQDRQITPGAALSVYTTYDPEVMSFRAGFSVSPEDAAKADAGIMAAATPAGRVLTFTHIGPYSELRKSYGKMMGHMDTKGLKPVAPSWEIYVNDPATTPPDKLETRAFVSVTESSAA
ncbi:MAG: GyrI-like domain-containing protein [Alphaproteobacteria bacterium]|nr:GyrI-like domain-containing protein [Alphaproteobacteria bacterium]